MLLDASHKDDSNVKWQEPKNKKRVEHKTGRGTSESEERACFDMAGDDAMVPM